MKNLMTANMARALLPDARAKKIESAIRFAVNDGDSVTFVRLTLKPHEVTMWEDLGYEVRADSSGSTFFYWHEEDGA